MVKSFERSKKEGFTLGDFIGSQKEAEKLEVELLRHGLKEKRKKNEITREQFEELRECIRKENYGMPLERVKGHPNCAEIKMKFPKTKENEPSKMEFICFGKRAEEDKIKKENYISKYLNEHYQGIALNPIYTSPNFIAFEFLSPAENVKLSKKLGAMKENEKIQVLEKIVSKIADISNVQVNTEIMNELKNKSYSREYASWGFAKDINYAHIAKRLDELSDSLIENDLHPNNIIVDSHDELKIIDWANAMYGVPQTDLARIMFSLGYESVAKNTDIEENSIRMLHSKLSPEKAGTLEEFRETYKLAKLHEYFKLAYECEKKLEKNIKTLNDPKLMKLYKEKYSRNAENIKEVMKIVEAEKKYLLDSGKEYAKLNGINI